MDMNSKILDILDNEKAFNEPISQPDSEPLSGISESSNLKHWTDSTSGSNLRTRQLRACLPEENDKRETFLWEFNCIIVILTAIIAFEVTINAYFLPFRNDQDHIHPDSQCQQEFSQRVHLRWAWFVECGDHQVGSYTSSAWLCRHGLFIWAWARQSHDKSLIN